MSSKNLQSPVLPPGNWQGVAVALGVIFSWAALLAWNLSRPLSPTDPWLYIGVLLQTHLFTGLFITAHDAMHGAVSPSNPRLNHFLGRLCAILFIFNTYDILRPKHYEHHRHVGTPDDPDYHKGNPNFWHWYVHFLKEYVTWKQMLLAAITFNIAGIWIAKPALGVFWVVPSLLSTLQLFYFGTFVPHMGEHNPENTHRSHTLGKNHIWAFVSCYFFGYHYEHHDSPRTPWWLLWKVKEQSLTTPPVNEAA